MLISVAVPSPKSFHSACFLSKALHISAISVIANAQCPGNQLLVCLQNLTENSMDICWGPQLRIVLEVSGKSGDCAKIQIKDMKPRNTSNLSLTEVSK